MKSEIHVRVAGDFCPIGRLGALLADNSAARRDVVAALAPLVRAADLFIVNLECPLTNASAPIEKCGSLVKGSPAAAGFLAEIGVNLVALANNHIRDYGDDGIQETQDACARFNLPTMGAAASHADAVRIHYRQIQGRTLAVVNMAEKEFSCSEPGHGGAQAFDVIAAAECIRDARRRADHVLLILHGGLENSHYPSPGSVRALRFLAEQGASAIVRHHPHRVQGHEVWKGVPIFYSVGHFLFDWHTPVHGEDCEGILAELSFTAEDRCSCAVHPLAQCEPERWFALLEGDEKARFMARFDEWSAVIGDEEALRETWRRLILEHADGYFGSLTLPYPVWVRIARKFGLLRFAHPLRWRRRLLESYLRCEAHRELLQGILEDDRRQLPGDR
jgi:poly-gamma-glutamate synthesis protein (capsule biosynthesis protein)